LAALGAAALTGVSAPQRGWASAAATPGQPTPALSKSGKPLRFVGVYAPHGRAHELWAPRDGFDIAYPDSILGPFDDAARYGRSFKDRLVVLDGVDLSAGVEVGTTGHDGSRVILTGSGANGKNASIDQFLAVEQGLGRDTLFASLVLGVGQDGTEITTNISYAAGGTPIPKWIDPQVTFGELFGRQLGQSSAEAAARRARGQSILDLVNADLKRLRDRAPASERIKLEQHAAALREMEKRLTMVAPVCAAPQAPRAFSQVHAYGGGEANFDAITDLQIDLLVRALSCDLTRFGTLYLADLSRGGLIPGYPNDVHTDVAHRYDAKTADHEGTPSTWQSLAVQNRYSMSKVARLLAGLNEAGVLEDTVVYVSSDMGDTARHSSRNVPTLLAGGAGGHLRMGQYLELGNQEHGLPNNRVLVSLCQMFGLPLERFGHSASPSITQGRLDALHFS
jgi:hypothetical protein